MKLPHFHTKDCRGITMLEIMVVSVLVVALLLIAYPLVGRVRESSQNIQCQANLRTAGKALQIYIADMDQLIITRRGGSRGGAGIDFWGAEISERGYLEEPARSDGYRSLNGEDPRVLRCPIGELPGDYSLTNWSWYTYGINMFTSGAKSETRNGTQLSIRHVSMIENPSRFVLLADSAMPPGFTQYFRISEGRAGLALRHLGKGNVLFLDNHIESVNRKYGEDLDFPGLYEVIP